MTSQSPSTADLGLEDVVAVTSSICFIDGHIGKLAYGGYDIVDLAEHATFEEIAYLLWHGELPKKSELDNLKKQFTESRALPPAIIDLLRSIPRDSNAMAVLRTAISLLALYDPEANDITPEAALRNSIRLTAQFGPIITAWARIAAGNEPVEADPKLSIAGNFLYQLHGKRPDAVEERAFDVALILHADHELNASTFAGRVTAATLSDVYSSVVSAIGALKGPLHGGANEQVQHMLERIGSADNAESYIRDALARHERLMGFGHRVYKVEDPRATVLRGLSKEIGERVGQPQWYAMSRVVEETVRRERGLITNVDFYSGSLYHALGIDTELFTPIFALSRITGWTAHILEQLGHNRLIRPRAEYVGPEPRTYVPIDRR